MEKQSRGAKVLSSMQGQTGFSEGEFEIDWRE